MGTLHITGDERSLDAIAQACARHEPPLDCWECGPEDDLGFAPFEWVKKAGPRSQRRWEWQGQGQRRPIYSDTDPNRKERGKKPGAAEVPRGDAAEPDQVAPEALEFDPDKLEATTDSVHDFLQSLTPDNLTHEKVQRLAEVLAGAKGREGMKVKGLRALGKQLGVTAYGAKSEMAQKISDHARAQVDRQAASPEGKAGTEADRLLAGGGAGRDLSKEEADEWSSILGEQGAELAPAPAPEKERYVTPDEEQVELPGAENDDIDLGPPEDDESIDLGDALVPPERGGDVDEDTIRRLESIRDQLHQALADIGKRDEDVELPEVPEQPLPAVAHPVPVDEEPVPGTHEHRADALEKALHAILAPEAEPEAQPEAPIEPFEPDETPTGEREWNSSEAKNWADLGVMDKAEAAEEAWQQTIGKMTRGKAEAEAQPEKPEPAAPETKAKPLTRVAAAKELRVAPRTVAKWVHEKRLPANGEGGTILPEDLKKFMADHGLEGLPAKPPPSRPKPPPRRPARKR